MKSFSILFIFLLCTLSSCREHAPTRDQNQSKKGYRASKLSAVAIQEAKVSDIPVPLSSVSLPRFFHSEDNRYMFGYKNNKLSPAQVADFYAAEMERCGWRSVLTITGHELFQQYEKPSRVCIVSIRAPLSAGKSEWVISSGLLESDDIS